MKVVLERDAFSAAVTAAFRAARGADKNIPILRSVLLTPNGSALHVAASNLHMRSQLSVPGEMLGDKSGIALPGGSLEKIAAALPQGSQLTLEWDDSRFAQVRCAGSRYKLPGLPAGDFPVFASQDSPIIFSMKGSDLARALQAVRFAVSNDTTRIYLTGVWLQAADNSHAAFGEQADRRLVFMATTLLEFGRVSVICPMGAEELPDILVPHEAVDEIIRQCTGVENEAEIMVTKNLIRVKTKDADFISKLVDAQLPNYAAGMPAANDCHAKFDSKGLCAVLSRIQGLGEIRTCVMTLKSGMATLRAAGRAGGDAEEQVEISYDGPEIVLGIKVAGLLDVVDATKSAVCVLRVSPEPTPILVNAIEKDQINYDATFLTTRLES